MFELTQTQVYLAKEPVDMRRQLDGLALWVQETLQQDPLFFKLVVAST